MGVWCAGCLAWRGRGGVGYPYAAVKLNRRTPHMWTQRASQLICPHPCWHNLSVSLRLNDPSAFQLKAWDMHPCSW
eukprot:33897-Eustigmatos_ZCMA.PRE.1